MTALTRRELPREVKKKRENTHKPERHCVVPVCMHFVGSFYFNSKSEADRDHHNRNVMSELRREICCSIVLFVCFEDQSGSRKRVPFRIQKMP